MTNMNFSLLSIIFLLSCTLPVTSVSSSGFVGSDPVSVLTKNFNNWIDENGGKEWSKIELAEIPGFRMGTIAREDIAVDDEYLRIPWKIVINEEAIFKSDVGDKFKGLKAKYNLDIGKLLLFFILHEMHRPLDNPSFWKPYIDTLPGSFNIPMYWTAEDLAELNGTGIPEEVKKYRKKVETSWEKFKTIVKDNDFPEGLESALDFDLYLWANALLDSRTIWINGRHRCFLPMLDMVNNKDHESRVHHTQKREVRGGAAETVTKSIWAVKKGEQLFENYGSSNYHNLLFHGFILDPVNSFDSVEFELPRPDKSLFPMLGKLRVRPVNTIKLTHLNSGWQGVAKPSALGSIFTQARVQTLPGNWKDTLKESQWSSLKFRGTNDTHEEKALQYVIDAVQSRMENGYVTNSIEEDEKRLRDSELTVNAKTAIKFRLHQRRLLRKFLSIVKERLAYKSEL
eukprot:g2955.t1